jgi:hypothetical protein
VIKIDYDTASKLALNNKMLYVPDSITEAIGSCIKSTPEDTQAELVALKAKYSEFDTKDEPIQVDYSKQTTIDAYSLGYLPRNTLLPKLLLLTIVEHPFFQNFPDELNILDLGSGTGGVVIGFLDLFRHEPLTKVHLNINACEISKPSLNRQLELIKLLNTAKARIWHTAIDFIKSTTYQNSIKKLGPYDFVISANFFTELPLEHIERILHFIPEILSDRGLFLIAEPPRLYTGKLTVNASRLLDEAGLSQFYPCPPERKCPKNQCWIWIETNFNSPEIVIGEESVKVPSILKTTWILFGKQRYSIYDIFADKQDWTFGVVAPYGRESDLKPDIDYEFCSNSSTKTLSRKGRSISETLDKKQILLRGSIFGFNKDFSEKVAWHPLFKNYIV